MGDFRAAPARSVAFREDCWSEVATETLVDAWGQRYVELNRGNLRQKDWQEVAEAVNSRHGHSVKTIRTDIQCKNRIDTVKKKYKAEKARVCDSDGMFVSSWPLFNKLDTLIVPKESFPRRKQPSGFGRGEMFSRTPPPLAIALEREANQLPLALAVAVTPHNKKMSSLPVADDSSFRRNYSVMAAAAAKHEYEEQEQQSEEEEEEEEQGYEEEQRSEEARQVEMNPTEKLAVAIERFGATYEKVEMMKLRQFMEIEQKRIDVGRDVELKRMQMVMDTQIQLEKLKRKQAKNKSDDICSS